MKRIAVIGCGYIGSAAAAIWTKRGHHVTATTRKPEKLESLGKISQKSLLFLGNNTEEFARLIANHDALLMSIGADDPGQYESTYLAPAKIFRQLALEMKMPKTLIYTSSTSIYGDHNGHWVDEMSPLHPTTPASKILADAEETYLSLKDLGWSVTALRFGEIYGPGREISKRVKNLKGHVLPGSGNQYTNMVHRDDCAGAIDYALQHHLIGIYNIADDDHPSRKELYDAVAKKFSLPKVGWDSSLTGIHVGNKRVSNHKVKGEGFSLAHPSRVLL
jgi:nucleoside-diphosphate-sugar epimerase